MIFIKVNLSSAKTIKAIIVFWYILIMFYFLSFAVAFLWINSFQVNAFEESHGKYFLSPALPAQAGIKFCWFHGAIPARVTADELKKVCAVVNDAAYIHR